MMREISASKLGEEKKWMLSWRHCCRSTSQKAVAVLLLLLPLQVRNGMRVVHVLIGSSVERGGDLRCCWVVCGTKAILVLGLVAIKAVTRLVGHSRRAHAGVLLHRVVDTERLRAVGNRVEELGAAKSQRLLLSIFDVETLARHSHYAAHDGFQVGWRRGRGASR